MSRKSCLLVFPLVTLLVLAGFSGCSSSSVGSIASSSKGTAPVSLSMTDDPPEGVAVLFFQVSLTDAELQPASGSPVSLLANNTPVQIDVTKLQALSAFLSTADVPAGTYNSLSLTFANPQLVIYNVSNTSLGSSCAVGTVCELTPTLDNASTVTLSSSPFPVTVDSGTPLGFMVDFHLNTVVQQDLTVDLTAANGITIATLPKQKKPNYGFLGGLVTGVNASANQFTLQTAWGRTFTVNASDSTQFTNFPTDSCATPALSCLKTNDVVLVQISGVEGKGVVDAAQVGFVADVNNLTVEGTVVGVTPAAQDGSTSASIKLLLHDVPSLNVNLPPGSKALVTIAPDATFTVDAQGFTLPTGVSFASAADLAVGQDVQVTVSPDTVVASAPTSSNGKGWRQPPAPSFTTTSVQLEPSQMTGKVSAISDTGFTLNSAPFFFCWWSMYQPTKPEATVETTAQTTFQGFATEDLSGVAVKDVVSVNGWLFAAPAASTTTAASRRGRAAWSGSNNSTPPTVVAQTVTFHSNGWF